MAEEVDQEFVEYIVKSIVDNPDDVKTDRTIDERGVLISLTVNPADMGKVIGKEGRTAKAVRTLLRVLGARRNSRVNMKILEPGGGEVRVPEEGDAGRDEDKKSRPSRSASRGHKEETTPMVEEAAPDTSDKEVAETRAAEEEKATEIL